VLVELGAAGPARDGGDLGTREQDPLDPRAELVRLGERGAGQRDGADGQRALVELRQEGAAEARGGDDGGDEAGEREGHDGPPAAHGGPQHRPVDGA
jgi:hypothetical protein